MVLDGCEGEMFEFDIVQKTSGEITSFLRDVWLVLCPDEFAGCSSQSSALQVSHPNYLAATFCGIWSWSSSPCMDLLGGDLFH